MSTSLHLYLCIRKAIFYFAFIFIGINSFSQNLDQSFGFNGTVSIPGENNDDVYFRTAILSKDKIYISYFTQDPEILTAKVTICKLNNDGSFNMDFGNDGRIGASQFDGGRMAIQNNNKIAVGGNYFLYRDQKPFPVEIKRYQNNGLPDTLFGTNGTFEKTYQNLSTVNYLAIKSGNKIIASASSVKVQNKRAVILQLNSHGEIDSSFGTNGYVYQT